MSNYTQSTNFATKDALPSGDPLKIVKGTEINTEFNNISVAIATKADLVSPTFTGTPTLPTGTIGVTQSAGNSSTALATTAFVQDIAAAVKTALFPIGAIYTAVVSTNPGTLLGFGTWTAFGAGRVMVGFDSGNALFDAAEETGGSADAIVVSHNHTATTGGAGSHAHTIRTSLGTSRDGGFGAVTTDANNFGTTMLAGNTDTVADHTHSVSVASTGSSGTNANYQPYITVYMWKRTA